jgi:O-Antigen ligase
MRSAASARMRVRAHEPTAGVLSGGLSRLDALRLQGLLWPLATTLALVALAAENGGYYATTWNWAALIVAWVAAVALLARDAVTLSRLELVTIGALFALVGWVALSGLWTDSLPSTVREVERDVLYPVAVLAVAAVFGRGSSRRLLGAVWIAIVLVSWYALATRIFPDRLGTFDPISGYRLSRPIGYWNALGLYAAIGMLLALGLAARGRHVITRLLGGASLVLLATTLYFTYSRGAWLALGIGLVGVIALDERRLQLITTALVIAPPGVLAVLAASRLRGLTHTDSALTRATRDGHRLAVILIVLAAAAVALSWTQDRIAVRLTVGQRLRRAYAALLVIALLAALALGVARYGSPGTIARNGWNQFTAFAPRTGGTNLNAHLFNLSSSGRTIQWHYAWRDARAHPVLGSGAGTYEIWYLRHRTDSAKVRDAHSLYVEMLAEIGPIGLTLLLAALLTPLVAALRARRSPLVASAAGAYLAFLVHAGVDWDWELPAVTIAGLVCGVVLLIEARGETKLLPVLRLRYALAGLAVAAALWSMVGLLGNIPTSAAEDAIGVSNWSRAAAEARSSIRWAPWSADGWRRRGQAELAQNHLAAARRDLRTAIRKDPQNWDRWFDLALATRGVTQRRALEHALALNPHSPEIAEFVAGVGLKGIRAPSRGGG